MNFLILAGKIIACSGILYGYYFLFLKNRRFHRYNRFFLISVLFLSFLLPFVEVPVFENAVGDPAVYKSLQLVTWGNFQEHNNVDISGNIFPASDLLWVIYVLGACLFLWFVVRAFGYIRSLQLKYPAEKMNDLHFHNTSEPGTPFSFFKSIFWNRAIDASSDTGQKILRHELFHVRQYHSFDVLLCELICIIGWFNPFFHLIRRELKAIHEFLADEYAAGNNDRHSYAELLVVQAMQLHNRQLVHPFFHDHLKRRINMITQFNSSRYGYWSRIMILPVAFILFCAISLYAQQSSANHAGKPMTANDQPFVLMIDAGHGGKDDGAKSADGNYSEKDIALAIAQQLREQAEAAGIKVLMSRTTDVSLTVQERAALNTNQKPDLFVSIHVGAGAEPVNNSIGGAEAYIGSKKQQTRVASIELGNSILNALQPVMKVITPVKERNNAGIWVLDQSPCPAVLIHCGFMTNENDVAFISDLNNQQKIATNILKGIIQFQNIRHQSTTQEKLPETGSSDIQSNQLVRQYLKNIRYPVWARENNQGMDLYFSIEVGTENKISGLKFHNSKPKENVGNYYEMVIAGSPNKTNKQKNSIEYYSKENVKELYTSEIKKATERLQSSENFSDIKSGKYTFKVTFTIEYAKAYKEQPIEFMPDHT